MRRTGARHRATYVIVRTSDGGVVVHRRADWKDVCPGYWDLCFGGVVDAGEDWDVAAARELAEQARSMSSDGPGTVDERPAEGTVAGRRRARDLSAPLGNGRHRSI